MRILITTWGSLGDIYPYLAIAEELNKLNASVTIACNTQHQELIESKGHGFRAIRPHFTPDAEFFRNAMDEFKGSRFLVKELLIPPIRESYADTLAAIPGHDAIVTHIATFAGPLAARATGIPWISTLLVPLGFLSSADPSVLASPLIGLRRRSPTLTNIVNGLSRRYASRWAHPICRLETELGQPSLGNPLFEGKHSPRAVLALFSPHFAAPQPDWPAQATATGFPLRPPAALPPVIERFLASGPPPVVFTLGSSAVLSPGRFFEQARQLGFRALLLAGAEAAHIPSSPDLLAVDYAPHSAVFPHAAAIVHQAGIGTTAEALRSGRPSLIVPFAHDQPDNAARCERLGVARVLPRRQLSLKSLKRELQLLQTTSTYAGSAAKLAVKIRAENGAATAARLILQNALS
jgi:rhamnosyltransferase subunit B